MTNKRNCYLRRKGDAIIAEGKQDGKTIFLWTIESDPAKLLEIYEKASALPKEKIVNLREKISRLDYRPEKKKSKADELPTTIITRTYQKDEESDDFDVPEIKKEEIQELKNIVEEFDF